MRRLALAMIRFYQRRLSPRKGFSCAYRVHTGGLSCSAYGAAVIARFGTVTGLALLRRRLKRCTAQHRLHPPRRPLPGLLRSQRGEVDADCGCELPEVAECGSEACDAADCIIDVWDVDDCAIDGCAPLDAWRERRKQRKQQQQQQAAQPAAEP